MKQSIWHSFCAALLLSAAAAAQGTYAEHLDRVRAAYGAAAWPAALARHDGLPLAALELPGLGGGALESDGVLVTREFTPVAAAASRPVLRLEARVCDDVETARETLLAWLAHVSSPRLAPEDGAFGLALGEAGYVGPSGAAAGAVSWVAFARGNVAVRLLNLDLPGSPQLDVLGAARAVDAAIASRPKLAPGALAARPEIARLAASQGAVVAGDAPRLDVAVVDPAGGVATLQWQVGGTGQGYVERRDDGWHLFTTGPGEVSATLLAISSTGTVAQGTVRVDVVSK